MRKEAKTVHNNKKANLVCHFFVSMRKFPQNLGLKRTSCSRAKLFAWFNRFLFKEALFRLFLLTASVFRFAFYIFVSLQEIRNFTGHPNPDPDGIGHIVLFFHFSCCQQVSWQRDEKYVFILVRNRISGEYIYYILNTYCIYININIYKYIYQIQKDF